MTVTAPDELRQQLRTCKTTKGRATPCRRLRPDTSRLHEPEQAATMALRSIGRRIAELDAEIAQLDIALTELVATAAPRTTALLAVSTSHAGQLLVTAGQNIEPSAATAPSPRSAAQARSPHHPAGPTDIASARAATATPTAPCT
jgi:hypothetical protein